jgi:hypothetical protein
MNFFLDKTILYAYFFGYDVHYEERIFRPGNVSCNLERLTNQYLEALPGIGGKAGSTKKR